MMKSAHFNNTFILLEFLSLIIAAFILKFSWNSFLNRFVAILLLQPADIRK